MKLRHTNRTSVRSSTCFYNKGAFENASNLNKRTPANGKDSKDAEYDGKIVKYDRSLSGLGALCRVESGRGGVERERGGGRGRGGGEV